MTIHFVFFQTLTSKTPEERYLIQYNVNVDFPMYDFNLWKQSGHLMTFGEALGSLQFMTERKISPEVASGIMARTLVEYWNERNVNTQSEETVQRRYFSICFLTFQIYDIAFRIPYW